MTLPNEFMIEKIVQQTRDYVLAHINASGVHGVDHWDRVYENGQKLITPKVRKGNRKDNSLLINIVERTNYVLGTMFFDSISFSI